MVFLGPFANVLLLEWSLTDECPRVFPSESPIRMVFLDREL
jgi:hypothetical protein